MKILVVDDEAHIRRLLHVALQRAGHAVVEAADAASALRLAAGAGIEAVLLDLGLPDRDGLELIALLKRMGEPAILILSARDATEEKVAALDLGADDYVTKPFDTEELLARLRTASRHRSGRPSDVIQVGAVRIDCGAHRVERSGREVSLTRKEFALLALLATHAGRVVTHGQMLRDIWGPAHESNIEYLRVAVRSLRQKLETDQARPTLIVNEPGIGYRLSGDIMPSPTRTAAP